MRPITARPHPEADEESVGLLKQTQERQGYPYGDCVRASYASLLEIPIKDIPHFDPRGDQTASERRWLRQRGLDLVIVPIVEGQPTPEVPDDVYHLVSGWSPRHPSHGHRVVGKGGAIVWDPHPSRAGLNRLRAFYFVVPLHPERVAKPAHQRVMRRGR